MSDKKNIDVVVEQVSNQNKIERFRVKRKFTVVSMKHKMTRTTYILWNS